MGTREIRASRSEWKIDDPYMSPWLGISRSPTPGGLTQLIYRNRQPATGLTLTFKL